MKHHSNSYIVYRYSLCSKRLTEWIVKIVILFHIIEHQLLFFVLEKWNSLERKSSANASLTFFRIHTFSNTYFFTSSLSLAPNFLFTILNTVSSVIGSFIRCSRLPRIHGQRTLVFSHFDRALPLSLSLSFSLSFPFL